MNRLATGAKVVKTLGVPWAVSRGKHEVRLRSGMIRRALPAIPWSSIALNDILVDGAMSDPAEFLRIRREGGPPFLFDASSRTRLQARVAAWDSGEIDVVARADRVVDGELTWFSHLTSAVQEPEDWHRNPFTGETYPANLHWTRISDAGNGDIKVVWEPSRFSFVYDLVRAYWRTGDERYAESYWNYVEFWAAANPPQLGPNWRCGQETSFRAMALTFGVQAFLYSQATTVERCELLARIIHESGRRIEAVIEYALSQQNNHGISEAMGLWTIGLQFPEFSRSSAWRAKGRNLLEKLGRELIYDDGAFSQHSANYHRLMLQDYVWSIRLGQVHHQPLSSDLIERIGRAANLLYEIQDETTGQGSNFGSNDGALILPLSNTAFGDYRPVIQSARFLSTGARTYPDGPWDEELFWMSGDPSLDAPVEQPSRESLKSPSGYITLRSSNGFAFMRCPTEFHHRPGDADVLSLELWWKGNNIALDPGTYSYNSLPPWNHALGSTEHHNTVTVDGHEQMPRLSKFLRSEWVHGNVTNTLNTRVDGLDVEGIEATHDGYWRLSDPVDYRRAVARLGDDHWLVVDRLVGKRLHDMRLHWLLANPATNVRTSGLDSGLVAEIDLQTCEGPFQVTIGGANGDFDVSGVKGDISHPRGWVSRRYFERSPALSIATSTHATSTHFWTLLGPPGSMLKVSTQGCHVRLPQFTVNCPVSTQQEDNILGQLRVIGS